ncbi:hypothetical protein NLU13_1768 [Sarocladium strictum]|uniref:alkaline phosphatase n=1 Tax=Sarocladium strictum TaxID=5046 RepID=A0AA39GRL4_SARSR|nr:hypothetical protein NLU13_1768 [Sarocladium strictum]
MLANKLNTALAVLASLSVASAQTFRRLGTCPTLGCVLPPDQSEFLPGQLFDLRVEVHAPVNGSEAAHDGKPDEAFTVTIAKGDEKPQDFAKAFDLQEPKLETWTFKWFEDLFAEDAGTPSVVNVTSKAYRKLALYEPGTYTVTLKYYNGEETTAKWTVRDIKPKRKAKNVIFFIGDGMTTSMITAARLLGHKSINGKYQSTMKMDEFPVLGHQMTHSIDTYITDSANSASALYTGHKSTVNALGVYADSSKDPFDDPKVETIVEIFRRYGPLIDQALNGMTNYSWTKQDGPDVYFGTGAQYFLPKDVAGSASYQGKNYYEEFAKKGYTVSLNKTSLLSADPSKKALGVFATGDLPTWLDRNVYKNNLEAFKNDPSGSGKPALDLPGLKEMTTKAVEILNKRGGDDGFFLMSEAASVDKQMHAMDYDRALGDLLELDDTIAATIKKLEELGILDETLIVVSADHGHAFDVWGSADTKYIQEKDDDREKRNAIGTYEKSGLSQYTVRKEGVNYGTPETFPMNWEPRYAIAAGVGAAPDHIENYKVHKNGSRKVTRELNGEYYANEADSPGGFLINGTLPTSESVGVHSLTDVAVYAWGPCQEAFGGTYGNIDIFYKMAECLGLATKDGEGEGGCKAKGKGEPKPKPTPGQH